MRYGSYALKLFDICASTTGTRVLLAGCIGGTFADYVLLPAAQAIPVPDGVEDHNAAQFVVNPLTALIMSTRSLTPKEGEYLLQTAGASVLGKLVCIWLWCKVAHVRSHHCLAL